MSATGTGAAARQALRLLVLGLLVGLLFGSVPLRQWTENLDPGPAAALLRGAAAVWADTAARAGLDRPYAAIRHAAAH